jgi:putative endonuclease
MATFYVYVLRNQQDQLYIGSTSDLEARIQRHQEGKAGWTRTRGPWQLVDKETFSSRSEAIRRERYLKSGKANQELRQRLISGKTPDVTR